MKDEGILQVTNQILYTNEYWDYKLAWNWGLLIYYELYCELLRGDCILLTIVSARWWGLIIRLLDFSAYIRT